MWTFFVVVLSPGIDDASRIDQVPEPMLIQAAIPERPVEAFDECILGRFPGLNEMQLGSGSLTPEEHRLAGQLAAVIADYGVGERSMLADLVKKPGKPFARDREVDDLTNALA